MKLRRTSAPALLVLGFACARDGAAVKPPPKETVQTLQARLNAGPPPFVGHDDEGVHLWKALRRYYKRHHDQPVWISGKRTRPEAETLVRVVGQAQAEGLDPAAYGLQHLVTGKLEPPQAAENELRLTYGFMRYAQHMLAGRIDPQDLDPQWSGQPRRMDVPDLLDRALGSGQFEATLTALAPRHDQYSRLKQELQRYREIAAKGGWPTSLPADLRLERGVGGPHVGALRERLTRSGDLPAPAGSPAPPGFFDDVLAQALARFERHHGLEPDGLPDRVTVAALNVPVEARIRQLEMNLERWRWLPEDLGPRHIVVNIPTFRLDAVENGQATLRMRVVAGTKEDPTPIFSDQMTHIIFSPYWNIPRSIAREETIPAVLRDPGYLRKNNLEIVKGTRVVDPSQVDLHDPGFDFRLRQRPGSKNALGLLKFIFPNKFNVYLHDTPADSLFARDQRDFSHGCVRVEKPVELAQWVLRSQPEWTAQRIHAAMHAGEERHVKIERPVPVYIVYQTAWAGDGAVYFSEDLYGLDEAQHALQWPAAR